MGGNGARTVFQFSFIADSAADIFVIYTNASGVSVTIPPAQYSVSINAPLTGQLWGQGGSVTYPLSGSPIASGTSLTISRILPLQQLTEISNQGNFYTQVTETALDTLEMQIQQVSARTGAYRGVWTTATIYNFGDIVQDGVNGAYTNNIYVCINSNTSGVWATDLANGDWSLSISVATLQPPGSFLPLSGGTISGNLTVAGTLTGNVIPVVNVKNYGATGNGTTDDSAAILSASTVVQASGGILFFPAGTYLVSNVNALNFTSGNVTIQGEGSASVILAAANAKLTQLIASSGANTLNIYDIVLDGNRANSGTAYLTSSYAAIIETANFKALRVEVRNFMRTGITFFPNSYSVNPANVTFDTCYFHDIGMTITDGVDNIGVGIFGPTMNLKIVNSTFENIHTTLTPLGDSAAVNAQTVGCVIANNYFFNNYNVNGGQFSVNDGSSAGIDPVQAVITGNVVLQTGTFDGDLTGGIEYQGSQAVISNNVIIGSTQASIIIEGSAGSVVVSDNVMSCTGPCVTLIASNGTGDGKVLIDSNSMLAGSVGVSCQTGATNVDVIVQNNYIDSSITTPIAGGNYAVIRNNSGWGFAKATYSPGVIANGAHVTTTLTVTGAGVAPTNTNVGDLAYGTYAADLQGVTLSAWVSTTNTVTLQFLNNTGGSITLGSATIQAWVEHRTI